MGGLRQILRAGRSQPWPIRVLMSGVGSQRVRNGLNELLDGPERPDAVLALGFAGALRDELRTGDLVLSRRLYSSGEEASLEADPRLLELAQEALQGSSMPRHYVADSVTVPRMVHSRAGKRRLTGHHHRLGCQHGRLLDRQGGHAEGSSLCKREGRVGYRGPGAPSLRCRYWE